MKNLAGRVAVITGAGSGIGEALSHACADAGMHVVIVDVDGPAAEATAQAVRERGASALAMSVDVRDPEAVEALADRVYRELGGCHLLCNNAGVLVMGSIETRMLADWDWVLGVNLRGVIHGIQAFVPRMIEAAEGGHIVNTASSAALYAFPANSIYTTSKFAVLGLTESLRLDLEEHGIGVSALCPGNVRTGLMRSDRPRPGELGESRISERDILKVVAAGDAANNEPVEPARVAELTLEAVRRNEAYIITHPGSKPLIERRMQALLDAYDLALTRDAC